MRGKLITGEGTDGAGKSTQMDMLIKYLEKKDQERYLKLIQTLGLKANK